MTPDILSILIILGVIIVMLSEKLPITVTALIGALVCGFAGLIPLSSLFSTLGSSTAMLLVGLGIIGEAFFRTGLGHKISVYILERIGKNEHGIYLSAMLLGCLLSAVANNTAVVITLIPLVKSLCKELDVSVNRMLYPLAAAASFGSALTLIGTPSNITGNTVLEAAGLPPMGFFDVAWVGVPLTICGFLWMLTLGKKLLPANTGYQGDPDENLSLQQSGNPKKMKITAVISIITLIIMMLQPSWMPLYAAALIGGIVLILTGCIKERDAWRATGMETLLLITGLMAISGAVTQSGGGELIAEWVIHILGGNTNPYFLTIVLGIVCTLLTSFLSNTAAVALMGPVAISIANSIGVNPVSMVMIVVITCNACFATPVGGVAFTLIVKPGNYKFKDFVRMGLPLTIINLAVAIAVIPLIWKF
ncbi:SLC13 family permease [Hominifimenecus sp. rT4P-3]|uniref:SLC13 family permease n=1 Tax=Hominifimenecus sp. rT4P-3 TaxID=3242979 RepID=UPI003DA465A5